MISFEADVTILYYFGDCWPEDAATQWEGARGPGDRAPVSTRDPCTGGYRGRPGFSKDYCWRLEWTIYALEHHRRASCRLYGREARVKFESGLFAFWPDAPAGTYSDIGELFGDVRIADLTFTQPGQVGWSISHEMYHWFNPGFGEDQGDRTSN